MIAVHIATKAPPPPVICRSIIERGPVKRDWLIVSSAFGRAEIRRASMEECGVTLAEFISEMRVPRIVLARHLYCFVCRVHTSSSYPAIGAMMGDRDHATAIYGATKIACNLDVFGEHVEAIEAAINRTDSDRNMPALGEYRAYFKGKSTSMRVKK